MDPKLIEFVTARLNDAEADARCDWQLAGGHRLPDDHPATRTLAEIDRQQQDLTVFTCPAALADWDDDKHGDVLRRLAEPYADHPDYRPEWRPGVYEPGEYRLSTRDDGTGGHNWHHRTPDSGLSCRRCGLAHKNWSGEDCPDSQQP